VTDLLTAPGDVSGATPTARSRLRENRGLIIVVVIVLLGAVVMALAESRRTSGAFDPDGFDRGGSHAVAQLLRDQGIDVIRVTRAQDAQQALLAHQGDVTLVIMPTAPLSSRMSALVQQAPSSHVVLVAPDQDTLAALAPWAVTVSFGGGSDEVAAGCTWPTAGLVGTLPPDGFTYHSNRDGTQRCWSGLVLDDSTGTPTTTIVGAAQAYTNDSLPTSGYAALSLDTLGRSHHLVWWLPSSADPLQASVDSPLTIDDLVPTWVRWALIQLALALLVVVWWRGRRLGRVVVEPLPVVVRATEAVEGRARLYRRGRARGRAADTLRTASIVRLRSRLTLPPSTDLATLAAAVAARTGRTPADVLTLLTPGSAPPDDASLTRLADLLDRLENEVRRS
jgi:hypothetical protein